MRAQILSAGFFLLTLATHAVTVLDAETVAAYNAILATAEPEQTTIALGDMVLPVETVRAWRNKLAGMRTPRSASQTGVNKWTGGIVYYTFNANVSAAHRTATLDAMAEWATYANLTFTARAAQANYIKINDVPGLGGGNSAVGMIGGEQQLNIGSTAWNRGTLLHEIGHALGLIHEHQRSDRDSYVTINPAVLSDGNFILIPTSTNNGAYDFLSVMHYTRNAPTYAPPDNITPKPAYIQYLDVMGAFIGDRILSRADRNGIALMYGAGPAVSTTVTTTKDSGPGSLRAAIYKAIDTVSDTPSASPAITFQVPNTDPNFSGGVFTITPTDRLPAPGPRTTVDATTQAAFTGNTNANGPEIVLNGAVQSAEPSTYGLGLRLIDANVTVKGFVIQAFGTRGILVTGSGATGCTIAGCYIGTNAAGTAAVANGFSGIEIASGASGNRIGGSSASDRNVISGNTTQGIYINGSGTNGNVVEGNFVGTDATGSAALANGTASHFAGVEISAGASGNMVGGTAAASRNLLSGNTGQGVAITGASANFVRGNYIGLNAAGTAAVPNTFAGVELFNAATNNTIGGSAAGAGNVLSGNLAQGVSLSGAGTSGNVIAGNFIGTNAAGSAAIGNGTPASRFSGVGIFSGANANTIGGTAAGAGNVISGNTGQGIFITGAGTNNNRVLGNWIGVNAAGTGAVANSWSGIEMGGGTQGNTVGGTTAAARNVISGNGIQGILIYGTGTSGNVVSGNYIGTNPAGSGALGNASPGVEFFSGASGNTIGGTAPGAVNVISCNGARNITVAGATNNVIAGNLIGLNAAGTAALTNPGPGVQLFGGAQFNTIGGTSGGRNFICGNSGEGLTISDSGTNGNSVVGNSIGIAPGGAAVANTGSGIALFGGPQGNTIGGTTPGAANLISGNAGPGVAIYNDTTTGNRISANSITANGGLGIDLGGNGVSANDVGDGDTGPANLQNFPVLSSAVLGVSTTVAGSLNSAPGTSFRIEFFENAAGVSGGRNFIGAANVTTNGSGNATLNELLPAIVPAGRAISATAIDPTGNTSEFSQTVTVTTTDSDGDGLPNAYETANTLSTSIADATLDSDGDGMTNAQEFRAHTNPKNPASLLRLAAPILSGNNAVLSLPTTLGLTYRVEFADALLPLTPWRTLADQIIGTGVPIPITDPGAAALSQRVYRAVILP